MNNQSKHRPHTVHMAKHLGRRRRRRRMKHARNEARTNHTTPKARSTRRHDATGDGAGDGTTRRTTAVVLPRDCSDPLLSEADSGVYRIQPLDQGPPIEVYCDMKTNGSGWTVFQRRQDGSVDFFLYWEEYRRGFGDLNGEFWLGNDNLHRITSQGEYELRIDMTDFDDNSAYAAYDTFAIGGSSDKYRLTATGYSGTAGDSLSIKHNNQPFVTRDRDDTKSSCTKLYHGAWWYKSCHSSNLNGKYLGGATDEYAKGVVWNAWKGQYYSLKTTEMKMRR